MEICYSYRDAPTVKRFAESSAFVRGLMGPFGSGKSSGCVVEIIRRAHEQAPGPDGIRRTRWAVVRNTYPQLKDTTIKTFHQWAPPHLFGDWNATSHTYTITAFKGVHIEVLFRALDRPDQVGNLLSMELTGAWINEAREIPWTIIQALMGRVGRYPSKVEGGASWYGIFMDTNPPDSDSWWYRQFEDVRPDGWEIFKQPSGLSAEAENLSNLPANYYKNLAATYDAEKRKVYVEGQYGFIIDGKPVYPEYNDTIHCSELVEPVRGLPILRGWDFGLTPACVLSQMLPGGRWQIVDEVIADNMGVDRFSDQVLAHCGLHYSGYEFTDIGDPAGTQKAQTDERTCFQVLHAKGIKIEPGDQDPNIRIESVKKPLNTLVDGKPGLLISPRCKMLRKGFQGGYQYRRMQTSEERYTDKPDKNMYSHVHDAAQYVATRLFTAGLKQHKGASKPINYDMRWVV